MAEELAADELDDGAQVVRHGVLEVEIDSSKSRLSQLDTPHNGSNSI